MAMVDILYPGVKVSELQRIGDHLTGFLEIKPDCPLFEGHFPGNPVLPALGQLKLIVELCRCVLGDNLAIHEIPRMKFVQPVSSNMSLSFSITLDYQQRRVGWSLAQGQTKVSTGTFQLQHMGETAPQPINGQ